jgi:hypothetical protein
MLGADASQIVERGAIAGQQKVIAVVDRHTDRSVVIGAAAAADERGRLVHDHLSAERREPHGGGKASEAGADDMDRGRH